MLFVHINYCGGRNCLKNSISLTQNIFAFLLLLLLDRGRLHHEVQLIIFYFTLILLRLFQQHYCYNVTGQSQESEGSCKPARIKEVHSKLHSFQASLCTLTATNLTLIYVCTYIRLSVPLGCLIKQAGIVIHTAYNPKYLGNTGNRTRDI